MTAGWLLAVVFIRHLNFVSQLRTRKL